MFLGYLLKELRERKGLSQEKLGKLTGVTKVSVCGYELGKKTPSVPQLEKIANVLDVTTDYLLGRDMGESYIGENEREYHYMISKEEAKTLFELRKRKELYYRLLQDPRRTFDLIEIKLNK